MRRFPNWLRFLACMFAGMLTVWAGLAVWVAAAPMSILDYTYPEILAKHRMVLACEPASVVVLGDSRAETGIDPAGLTLPTINLAIGGGNPANDYYTLRQILACNQKPQLVILSYTLTHFVRFDPIGFWNEVVGFDIMPHEDRDDIFATAELTANPLLFKSMKGDTLPPLSIVPPRWMRFLYSIYFPPLYTASALASLESGVIPRLHANEEEYAATFSRRGHMWLGRHASSDAPANEVELTTDVPSPAMEHYLTGMLTMLEEARIPALLLTMPVNDATYSGMRKPVRDGFTKFIRMLTRRYPNMIVADDDPPRWPDRAFGDAYMHANPTGAAAVASVLNACLPPIIAHAGQESAGRCHLTSYRFADAGPAR